MVETYWDSPEAKKLFLGDSTDERDVVEVLEQRIERLQQANKTINGWKDIVDKHDIDNLCSYYDVFIIRQRCSILCLAYIYALEEMNSARWIEDCCAQAIFDSSKMGIEAAATTARAVAGWNILLRANREHFPLPNPRIHKQNNPLPESLIAMIESSHLFLAIH
jgi:Zn-finger protein